MCSGERECVRFAKPAWDLYGAGDNVGYAIAKGRHSLDARDWSRYMDFADKRMTTSYAESMRGAFAAESGAEEIVLCDQLKQTIDIYDAGGQARMGSRAILQEPRPQVRRRPCRGGEVNLGKQDLFSQIRG